MRKASSDLVQSQFLELAQQVIHVIQVCNEEKEILEDEFDMVKNNIEIVETCGNTERQSIDSKGSRVRCRME